ncbi:hypothetical protein [Azospirillum sp.]|uniref:hypothetical protein n=1 Tax=Azospirillum sp. TaxID=34012 RepID=UPI003D717B6A
MMLAATIAALVAAPGLPAAEPAQGTYVIRCQDPATRQWTVLIDRIKNPETTERPASEGGGRVVRGTGPTGEPVTITMPADRTCMMSAL